MKTTLDIPADLLKETKATADVRGETLKDFVAAALRAYLAGQRAEAASRSGWRAVFGKAPREAVEKVDAVVEKEFPCFAS